MPGDAAVIAADGLRGADIAELEGLGKEPYLGLLESVEMAPTDTFTVIADGHPVAVFGVASGPHGWGSPWFLASDGIQQISRRFAEQTIYWVEWMNFVYPKLINYMADDNKLSKLWLRKAGFTIHPPQPIGVNGKKYCAFTRLR